MQSLTISVFPPGLDRHEPFEVKCMLSGETHYLDEITIADLDTLGTVLRKIDDDPKILATWNMYLEKSQPFSVASTDETWERIKDWLSENLHSKYW